MNLIKGFLVTIFFYTPTYADGFNYFEKRIDYFSEETPKPLSKSHDKAESAPRFDWQKFMNPANVEFFKEGDHVPPEPFMEVARNPTDENLKMWIGYVEKKNKVASHFQERMADFLKINNKPAVAKPEQLPRPLDVETTDTQRFQFRLFFDSSCPHCKNMFPTMKELRTAGFKVDGRQTDDQTLNFETAGFEFEKAKKDELLKHQIQSVPLLLIADRQSKQVQKISGFLNTQEVLQKLKQFKK